MNFEKHLKYRYNNKLGNDHSRFDREGHKIQFLLTLEQFRELFLPFKDDPRFYDSSDVKNYLCVARNNDLGDYVIGNVKVMTMGENASERNRLNGNRGSIESLKDAFERFYSNNPGSFTGKKHSLESLDKQAKSFKEIDHQQGDKNSQFGTCWIYSVVERMSKKIPAEDLAEWEAKGWLKGRKMRF